MGLLDKFKKKKKSDPEGAPSPQAQKKEPEKATVVPPEVAPGLQPAPVKQKEGKTKKQKKHDTKDAYRVLIRPVLTEKSSDLGMYNQYVFEVSPRANKVEVKKAVQDLYGVEPVAVNIINQSGKFTQYGRSEGFTKNWKKAVVTLKQGDKIEVYEGV